jgi:pimeloyl-ACP methyl ester carboxylesterase
VSAAGTTPFAVGEAPVLRGERAGEGPPLVLCHGVTATRQYVVHGSMHLPRAGYEVFAYDARGHGESDPAPVGEGYGYPELVADLDLVIEEEMGERPVVLVGHSMGAHTCVAFVLRWPERVAGLVVIGPVYAGGIPNEGLTYWDGLATALEEGGVEDFLAQIDRLQEIDAAWRDSILRFTRERMLRHRHLDAVVRALREVPRSRPFGSLEDLEALDVPALVVASHDDADPGHPYEVAGAYAERLPRATLVSEAEGQSPLAWQGGRLSREIEKFCESIAFGR